MIFLDPKSDIAFKKLFGTITHKNIVISFLNSVLEHTDHQKIVDVVINDPTNIPETQNSKSSIMLARRSFSEGWVDVRCTDQRGNQYIVEMQVLDRDDFMPRAQYYSALGLGRQLASGDKYNKLVPVIFIGILDFKLFNNNPHYISHHLILDKVTHDHELQHLEFHFVELAKFNKSLEQVVTDLDKWIYFFKHAVTLNAIPQLLKDPVMQEAFKVLEQANWSRNELEAYDRYMDELRSADSYIDTAERKGRLGEKKRMAKVLLARGVMTLEEIGQVSELDPSEIEKLKKGE